MHRRVTIIAAVVLLTLPISCFGIPDSLHGPVFWFRGHYYGVYDQWHFDLPTQDGRMIDVYECGIALGPIGRFGRHTTTPWVRQLAPWVIGSVTLCVAAWGSRLLYRRVRLANDTG